MEQRASCLSTVAQHTHTCKLVIVMINIGNTTLCHPVWSVIILAINFVSLHIMMQILLNVI